MMSSGFLGRYWLRLLGALSVLTVLAWQGTAQAYEVYPAQAGQGSITDDSTCNLADALDSVRQGTPLHGCEGPAVSSVTLHATTKSVTYKLNAMANITNAVYLYSDADDPSYVVTVRGYMSESMFSITSTGSLVLYHLTVLHNSGSAGHIVNQGGYLEIDYCTLTNGGTTANWSNQGGSIYNYDGRVYIDNSTFSGNKAASGGAIWSYTPNASFDIYNSSLTGNTATDSGGAILSSGASGMDLYSSTLSGNTAGVNGGAIYSSGRLRVTNLTISGNKATGGAGGGIYVGSGGNNYLEIFYSTIAFNHSLTQGGGVFNYNVGSPTSTTHCIVAKNTYDTNNTASDYRGNPQSQGASISWFGVSTGITSFDSATNRTGDAKLSSTLATNSFSGSPILKTHRLLSTSPAKDLVPYNDLSQTGSSSDERGFARGCAVSGGYCDLGAFERQSFDP